MRIAICDDDEIYAESISKHIDFFSLNNAIEMEQSVFTSAEDVLNSNLKFDIAVLDVEMKGINGIELGEKLRKTNPHIALIYITSYRKYLDDALNLSAVRFFEKPIDYKRFYKGLSDAVNRIDKTSVKFYLRDDATIECIDKQDIVLVEIQNRGTKVITETKAYYSSNHINYWNEKLTSSIFASPHKSYIINLNYVTAYERRHVILANKYRVAISRNKQSDFYRLFMRFVEGK